MPSGQKITFHWLSRKKVENYQHLSMWLAAVINQYCLATRMVSATHLAFIQAAWADQVAQNMADSHLVVVDTAVSATLLSAAYPVY